MAAEAPAHLKTLPAAVPPRLLLGPGPQNASPRVHAAMSMPLLGHMDPSFLAIADEVKQLLRYVWQTKNEFTLPISGSASAAWEACVANLTEPGDVHVVFSAGYFGSRAADMHARYGADVRVVEKEYGEVFTLAEVEEALATHAPALAWLCHAETSTGALQPVAGVGAACRRAGCLLLLDTVTSLCGVPVLIDEWQVDAAYAGTQKCMGVPPGISALTLNDRALAKMGDRKSAVASWYLDLGMIRAYLGKGANRVYHHTAPVAMMYGLREGLAIVAEEGLRRRWEAHRSNAELLWRELEAIGLECMVPAENRLPPLTTVRVPPDIDGAKLVADMREKFQIEIGGALGPLRGKVWRLGLMGYNSRKEVVLSLVACLADCLRSQRARALGPCLRARSRL